METDDMGLRYAQVDISLFADTKVRKLFRHPDERMAYAAIGLWLDVLVQSWADESREPSGDKTTEDTELCDLLVSVGLFDEFHSIPAGSWTKWFAPVGERRRKWREDKQRQRGVSVDIGGHGVDTRGHGVDLTLRSSSTSLSLPREVQPREHSIAPAREGGDPLIDALGAAMQVVVPKQVSISWADNLAEKYGEDRTIAALGEASTMVEPHKVISTAEGLLERAAIEGERASKRHREAEEQQARRDRSARASPSDEARTDLRPLGDILPGLQQSLRQHDKTDPDGVSSISGDGRLPEGEQA